MTHPSVGAHPTPAAAGGDALLDGLTPEQAQAVRHGRGPLLLIAGPGAGKTKTLIHRVARLLAIGAAQPWEILAVTFSVRAAGELRLRLADLLGEQVARGVTAATFHSICARMLREHAGVFGRTADYTVYDQADVRRVIEWLLSDQQRGQIQQALADYGQPAAAEVLAEISLAKSRLLSPDSYEQAARHTAAPLIATVWREAEVELQRSNSFDFDDLLVYAVRLLAEHPHRLAFYRQRWRWLLVDEYQDTNEAQSVLVALLAGAGGNVCCVGDDDQLLYSWRGAEPRNMLAFGERFPASHPDRARPQLPLPRRDPRGRRRVRRSQHPAGAQGADRGPGRRRRRARDRLRTPTARRRSPSPPRSRRRSPTASPPAKCWCSAGPGTASGRCRRSSRRPGSRIACSAASACTSAPRSAMRSPTWRCWSTRPTRRRSAAPSDPRDAASGPRPPTAWSRSPANGTTAT